MYLSTVRVWAWRLALCGSVMVLVLSIVGGVSLLIAVIRGIFAYGLIYGLSELSCILFEKAAIEAEEALGALLDIAVGQDEKHPLEDMGQGETSQISRPYGEAGMTQGGLKQAPLAGQVNQELAQGFPDEEKQAEIVRRMGWGE